MIRSNEGPFPKIKDGDIVKFCSMEEWLKCGGDSKLWLVRKNEIAAIILRCLGVDRTKWEERECRILIDFIKGDEEHVRCSHYFALVEDLRGEWRPIDFEWRISHGREDIDRGMRNLDRYLVKCRKDLLISDREVLEITTRRM
jgi:hypothetical protein